LNDQTSVFLLQKSIVELITQYRLEHKITVNLDGPDIPPFTNFDEAKLAHPEVEELLNGFCAGFTTPTPIQSQCWPIALDGR
jgi:superfamily II DNA/RNA helicase